jgi:peptidyl-prolyl cis-trans isomerase C
MSNQAGFRAKVALAVALSLVPFGSVHAAGETAETVVASVNGTDITLGQVVALGQQLPEQYQQLADDVLYKAIVDQLVQQLTLAQTVEGKLTKRDELTLQNQRLAYLAGTILQGVVSAEVTEDAIKAAYDARVAALPPGTEYHAAHILVADEPKAKDLKTQIDGGADFAEVAKANSSDGSAANGGDLGWFGVGMMVKPFEDAVVAMKPGEVSAPIQTQFGWHLIKLNETRPAAPPTLDDLRAEITQELQRKAVDDYVAKISTDAKITRVDGIDPALLRDQNLLGK